MFGLKSPRAVDDGAAPPACRGHTPCSLKHVCLHACDKSEVCCGFIKAHTSPPMHLHTNLLARLSRSAVQDLKKAEQDATEAFTSLDPNDKVGKEHLGESLLEQYMSILSRPGSMVSKSFCRGHKFWVGDTVTRHNSDFRQHYTVSLRELSCC